MRKTLFRAVTFLICVLCVFGAISCSKKKEEEGKPERLDFMKLSDAELAECGILGKYTGLDVTLGQKTKGEAVWAAVIESFKFGNIPQQQTEHYVEQEKSRYSYYAQKAGLSYEEMLSELGISESDIRADAIAMVKQDIVYEAVRRDAKIELSDAEKQEHFDKYVKKYVADYGYTEKYVKENLSDLVYSSMLYDKTTEFLITKNNISE